MAMRTASKNNEKKNKTAPLQNEYGVARLFQAHLGLMACFLMGLCLRLCVAWERARGELNTNDVAYIERAQNWLFQPQNMRAASAFGDAVSIFLMHAMRVLAAMGVTALQAQLYVLFFLLSFCSAWLLLSLDDFACFVADKKVARCVTFLWATGYIFMVFGTQLLPEAVVMLPFFIGLAALQKKQSLQACLAGFCLGLAAFIYAPCAIAMLGYGAWTIDYRARQLSDKNLGTRHVIFGLTGLCGAGSLLVVLLHGVTEASIADWVAALWRGGMPLSSHSTTPIVFALGYWLLLSLPLGLVLRTRRKQEQRAAWKRIVWGIWLPYIAVHLLLEQHAWSSVLPVLPVGMLALVRLAADWARQADRTWWGYIGAAALCLLLAIGGCWSFDRQNHVAYAQLTRYLRADALADGVIAVGPPLQHVFWGSNRALLEFLEKPEPGALRRAQRRIEKAGHHVNRLAFYAAQSQDAELLLILEGFSCADPMRFEGGFWSHWLYRRDPQYHASHGPLLLYACENNEMAGSRNRDLQHDMTVDATENRLALFAWRRPDGVYFSR